MSAPAASRRLTISSRNLAVASQLVTQLAEPVEVLRICANDGEVMPASLATALANARSLSSLRRLEVADIDLGQAALEALTTSEQFANLEQIALLGCDWGSKLGDRIVTALSGAANLPKLRSLEFASIDLGPSAMSGLGSSESLGGLRRLRVAECKIKDVGLCALIDLPIWRRLEDLYLTANGVTDHGLGHLARAVEPPSLRRLHVEDRALSPNAKAELSARFGRRLVRSSTWWS